MKQFFLTLTLVLFPVLLSAQATRELPSSIFVEYNAGHIQGFAVDQEKGFVYISFTTVFLKTDLQGKILATIDKIPGHLGAMTFNPSDGKVYASLEFKDDDIGKGVAAMTGTKTVSADDVVFYIAIIDVDKLDRIGMVGENSDILKTVCIKEVLADYRGKSGDLPHRYGTAGMDGVTIAPKLGKAGGRMDLYLAYGIYEDCTRTDNDHQIILRYDISGWGEYAQPVRYDNKHHSGPEKPDDKYFVYTGNTAWGVQNLAYDPSQQRLFLAVYKGSKPQFPNYDLFSVSVLDKPVKGFAKGVDDGKHKLLKLAPGGLSQDGINGWRFKWGSTGMFPVGDGLWYLSEHGKKNGVQNSTLRLYRWTGDKDKPFLPAE